MVVRSATSRVRVLRETRHATVLAKPAQRAHPVSTDSVATGHHVSVECTKVLVATLKLVGGVNGRGLDGGIINQNISLTCTYITNLSNVLCVNGIKSS